MVITSNTGTSTRSKTVELHKYNTTTEWNHLKQTTAVVGVMVNLRMVTTIVTNTT